MALHLVRRQDLSHTDHHSSPSEAQGSFAAHPVTVVLLKKRHIFIWLSAEHNIELFTAIFMSHDMGWT
jgi:hypothetical protein